MNSTNLRVYMHMRNLFGKGKRRNKCRRRRRRKGFEGK
jgi:hypothetical protein